MTTTSSTSCFWLRLLLLLECSPSYWPQRQGLPDLSCSIIVAHARMFSTRGARGVQGRWQRHLGSPGGGARGVRAAAMSGRGGGESRCRPGERTDAWVRASRLGSRGGDYCKNASIRRDLAGRFLQKWSTSLLSLWI
jgi:hypothetical protein